MHHLIHLPKRCVGVFGFTRWLIGRFHSWPFSHIHHTFFVLVYVTLFLSADTRGSAIAGLLWLVVFGGYCLLHERFQNRDLKAALGK